MIMLPVWKKKGKETVFCSWEKLSLRKRFKETEIIIDYWIFKVENIEIKGTNAFVFMSAALQQP